MNAQGDSQSKLTRYVDGRQNGLLSATGNRRKPWSGALPTKRSYPNRLEITPSLLRAKDHNE
jgi:hypothetical protein